MSNVVQQLDERFRDAIVRAFGDEYRGVDPMIKPSGKPGFGDYQANVAMGLAKQLGRKPRDVADAIVGQLRLEDVCSKVEIAGPGFINLYLTDAYIAAQLRNKPDLSTSSPLKVVIDYSGPNGAKEMHVGHLRSTAIGDAISRVLEKQGHHVIRQNHMGDWGTQFGMLIEHMVDMGAREDVGAFEVHDLDQFYRDAKKRFDDDAGFADRARKRVVLLQGGDAQTNRLWRMLIDASYVHFQDIYERLGVKLTAADVRAESAYNDMLPGVIEALKAAGLLKESQGAKVVYPDGFKDREDNPMPLIVQKSDGGYLYATTDLAAMRYRLKELNAERVIYVTDARQSQHFAMVFKTVRDAGWAGDAVIEHVPFGTVLGPDRKPFKTREGGTVKLSALLDEAEERAAKVITEKNPELSLEQRTHVAHVVGIGALKYADLSGDRIKDYVFDWDRMLAFEGNTAPYIQNAYVRIRSIFRKLGRDVASRAESVTLTDPAERVLAVHILQFPGAVNAVGDSLEPHRLCTYLYELASAFHQFYERCPVLTAVGDGVRESRLALSAVTADTLREGLDLLGIDVIDQM